MRDATPPRPSIVGRLMKAPSIPYSPAKGAATATGPSEKPRMVSTMRQSEKAMP